MKIKNNLYYNILNAKFEIYIRKLTIIIFLYQKQLAIATFNYNSFCLNIAVI